MCITHEYTVKQTTSHDSVAWYNRTPNKQHNDDWVDNGTSYLKAIIIATNAHITEIIE